MSQEWRPRTKLVHEGARRSQFHELSEAIFLTQGFAYPDAETAERRFNGEEAGFVYARYANPTVAMFEDRLAALEGAEACFATASGMAAANATLFSQLSAGDKVVASRALFGSCLYILETLLPRFGVETVFVEGTDLDAWAAAAPGAKLFFIESPSNPVLEVLDIPAIAEIAHGVGAQLIVDNVFATPIFQRPLALGADIVFYSTTKHIDGQGRCLGGAILGRADYIRGPLFDFMKHTGAAMSPFTAWVMLKGLETLDLRVRAMAQTSLDIAEALSGHPKIAWVRHPGRADHPQHDLAMRQMEKAGTMVAFEVAGGQAGAFRFLNALEIATISNNLGDAKTIATHPTTTTHQRLSEEQRLGLGITPGTIRLSAGLEDSRDLCADLLAALDHV